MVKVLKTNNNYFVAFADDVTLSNEEIRQYKAATYNDAKIPNSFQFCEQFSKADCNLTRRLMTEMQQHKTNSKTFVNELADNTQFKQHIEELAKQTKRIPLYVDYIISNNDLPVDAQNSNTPIRRKEEFYFPKYDAAKGEYICQNKDSVEIKLKKTRAGFNFKENEVIIYDKVFFFTKEDQQTIKHINNLRSKPDAKEELLTLSPQQIALGYFYDKIKSQYLDKNQKLYSTTHEFKHALTENKINNRKRNPNYLELSPTNTYRFNEDDEKSAHLQETYKGIENYYKSGGDLSVFPKKCQWLVEELKKLSPSKQLELLSNEEYIVNGNINNWNKLYSDVYSQSDGEDSSQLMEKAVTQAWEAPIFRGENKNEEYIEQRSIAYTIDVYNPQTQSHQKKDMSRHIKISTVIHEHNQQKINQAETILKQRQNVLEASGITRDLISSLIKGTYQEPFKINTNTTEIIKQQLLAQGITLKTKNKKGEPIVIKAQKQNLPNRPNCLSLTSYRDNQPIFNFVLDEDKKEYNCFNYRTKQKYSNLSNSKHQELPEEIKNIIKGYLKNISDEAQLQASNQTRNNSGNNR